MAQRPGQKTEEPAKTDPEGTAAPKQKKKGKKKEGEGEAAAAPQQSGSALDALDALSGSKQTEKISADSIDGGIPEPDRNLPKGNVGGRQRKGRGGAINFEKLGKPCANITGLQDYLDRNGITWIDPDTGQPGKITDYVVNHPGYKAQITFPGDERDIYVRQASNFEKTKYDSPAPIRGAKVNKSYKSSKGGFFPVEVPEDHVMAAWRAGQQRGLADPRTDPGDMYNVSKGDDGRTTFDQGEQIRGRRVGAQKRFKPFEAGLEEPEKRVWDAMARLGGQTAKTKPRPDGSMAVMGKRFAFPELVKQVTQMINSRPQLQGGIQKIVMKEEEVAQLILSILEKDRTPGQKGFGKRILGVSHKDDPKGKRLPKEVRVMQGGDLGVLGQPNMIGANDVVITMPFYPPGYDPNKEVQAKAQLPSGLPHVAGGAPPEANEPPPSAIPELESPYARRIAQEKELRRQQGLPVAPDADPNAPVETEIGASSIQAVKQLIASGNIGSAMVLIDKMKEKLGTAFPQVWERVEATLKADPKMADGLRQVHLIKAGYERIITALKSSKLTNALKIVRQITSLPGMASQGIWKQIEEKLFKDIEAIRASDPKLAGIMEENMMKLLEAIEQAGQQGPATQAVENTLYQMRQMLENVQIQLSCSFYNLVEQCRI